jgi:DNA-binding GntR family transcriptional regulator
MSPRTKASGQRRRRAASAAKEPVRLVPREGADNEGAALPNSERVYRSLRDQILTGALAPLTRLVELHVAQQFAVSRTPVREALKRLIAEGLVVGDPMRGMVVRDVDPAEVEDIYIIREVLDGLAARLAASRASATDLVRLQLLMELMQESAGAQRWEAVVQINIKFHEVLYSAAGNERLALIGRSLQDGVRRYSPRALSDPERVAAVLREHAEIVRALEAHDLDGAEASARRHLAAARQNFTALFAHESA